MYQKKLLIALSFFLITITAFTQAKLKKLPTNINRPSINLWAPFISGDGQTLIYLTDYTDDGHHAMNWATKKTVSTWNDGKLVNRLINRPTLNFRGGYSLSFDGDQLFFGSLKSGLGGFDIWSSQRRGNDWEAPKNMGLPINSRANEGSPFLSPDGEYLYFMRCEKMKAYGGASECKLFYSKKSYSGWTEPVELPENINTGNSQTPRLLADGETLIFSTDKMGGQGKLDLFMSKKTGDNQWSDPVPMTFANTPEDDNFVTIPAKGRYMYRDVAGPRDNELVQVLIPDEFQPKSVMRIQGKITDNAGEPVNAELTIFNIDERDRLWNEKVGKAGEFAIVLKEGSSYDLSVDGGSSYMFYSKVYDLNEIGARDKQRLNIKLQPLAAGETYPLEIFFKPHSSAPQDISLYSLRRLGDFLRQNSSIEVEIGIHQTHYVEDTVQSHPDLTEIRQDTVNYDIPFVEESLIASNHDSLFHILKQNWVSRTDVTIDSVNYMVRLTDDSVRIKETTIITSQNSRPDSLQTDSLAVSTAPPLPDTVMTSYPLTKYKIISIYHNDRTQEQGESVSEFLIGRGVSPDQFTVRGYLQKRDEPLEEEDAQTVEMRLKILKIE